MIDKESLIVTVGVVNTLGTCYGYYRAQNGKPFPIVYLVGFILFFGLLVWNGM